MTVSIPIQAKREVTNDLLQKWKNTYFQQQLIAEVAEDLSDRKMLDDAKAQMVRCLQAIKLLEGKLAELSDGVTEVTNDET